MSDPSKLIEEYTRYHLFLQIRHDILDGKLIYPHSVLIKLCSYVVQCKYQFFESLLFLINK